MSCRSEPARAVLRARGSSSEQSSLCDLGQKKTTQMQITRCCKAAAMQTRKSQGAKELWDLPHLPGGPGHCPQGADSASQQELEYPGGVGKNSRKQRQQNLRGHCADCSQPPLKDRGLLHRGKGATGHQESFQPRLPVRRSAGSNANGPKPPVRITSSITAPDDK